MCTALQLQIYATYCESVNNRPIDVLHSKRCTCSFAMKQKAVHIGIWYETETRRDETFDFQSETRSRPRPSHVSTRPRRDRDVWKLRLETVSRPRGPDRDYIPGLKSRPQFNVYSTINTHILKYISQSNMKDNG